MTIAELVFELKHTTTSFEWKLVGNRKRLYGFLKSAETPISFDPICALAFVKTGQRFEHSSLLRAGEAIGLSPDDCSDIIDASNNLLEADTSGSIPDPYKAWLRRQLIFAAGLNFPSRPNAIWTHIRKWS